MSGTYPSNPVFESVNFRINTPTLITQTFSGRSRRVGMGISYYSFSVKYPSITAAEFGPVLGFLSQQFGPLEAFQIILPRVSYSKSQYQTTTTVTTSAAATKGQITVGVTGVASGKTLLYAGDYFKFANHSKVYMCAVDWGAGQLLQFSGSLVVNVPSGTQITYTAVPFTVMLEDEIQEYNVGYGGISTMSLNMRETW